MSSVRSLAAAALVSVVLTVLLYGSALDLPFYSDDLLQVPWQRATTLLDTWREVGPYGDYQPLHFSLWRVLYLLAGDLQPRLLHSLNLAAHALCGTLVALVAVRLLGGRPLAAPLAAALFVTFPFASDAVPWAAAFCYPLSTALAVGSLLTYLRARQSDSRAWHLLAAVLAGLAGFAHEGAVVAGCVALLAEWTVCRRRHGRVSRWPLAHLGAAAVPLLAGALIRPQGAALHGLVWPDVGLSIAYAVQALVFPVAPAAQIVCRAGVSPALAVMGVGLPVLAAAAWTSRRRARLGPLLLATGWWALWSVPPLLTLRFDWLSDAPRTFYWAAVGAALLWTVVLDRLQAAVAPHPRRTLRTAALSALVVLCLLPAGWFVLSRMDLHQQVGDLLWDVVESAQGQRSLLLVNLPARITPPGRLYPLGHEGLIPLPPRVGADDLVVAHGGQPGVAFDRAWGPVQPVLPYAVQLLGQTLAAEDLRTAGRVMLVSYQSRTMTLREAGAVLPPGSESGAAQARFGQYLSLLSVSCRRVDGGRVALSTRWQVTGVLEGTPTIFAHLLGSDGALLAQADGDPLRGLYPLSWWQVGEVVLDQRVFEDAPEGAASVALGVWDPAEGARWAAVGPGGQPLPHDAVVCAVP